MLGGADNLNGELLSYIIGADTLAYLTTTVMGVSPNPRKSCVFIIRIFSESKVE